MAGVAWPAATADEEYSGDGAMNVRFQTVYNRALL